MAVFVEQAGRSGMLHAARFCACCIVYCTYMQNLMQLQKYASLPVRSDLPADSFCLLFGCCMSTKPAIEFRVQHLSVTDSALLSMSGRSAVGKSTKHVCICCKRISVEITAAATTVRASSRRHT